MGEILCVNSQGKTFKHFRITFGKGLPWYSSLGWLAEGSLYKTRLFSRDGFTAPVFVCLHFQYFVSE